MSEEYPDISERALMDAEERRAMNRRARRRLTRVRPLTPSQVFEANRRRLLLEEGTSQAQRRVPQQRVFDRGTCPGCAGRVVDGDTELSEPVVRVSLPATGVRWWHQSCRAAALAALRAEREGEAM
jgi:hypothetical protein